MDDATAGGEKLLVTNRLNQQDKCNCRRRRRRRRLSDGSWSQRVCRVSWWSSRVRSHTGHTSQLSRPPNTSQKRFQRDVMDEGPGLLLEPSDPATGLNVELSQNRGGRGVGGVCLCVRRDSVSVCRRQPGRSIRMHTH